jgi:hypothetical protein
MMATGPFNISGKYFPFQLSFLILSSSFQYLSAYDTGKQDNRKVTINKQKKVCQHDTFQDLPLRL